MRCQFSTLSILPFQKLVSCSSSLNTSFSIWTTESSSSPCHVSSFMSFSEPGSDNWGVVISYNCIWTYNYPKARRYLIKVT